MSWLRRITSRCRLTLIEWSVVLAIVSVLVALLLPSAQWASSGSMTFPVRVIVFNAQDNSPIPDAWVTIFRAPPITQPQSLSPLDEQKGRPYLGETSFLWDTESGATDSQGAVVIESPFRTGANHVRPTPYAHTRWAWISVQADGFTGAMTPVRHASMPTATLRQQQVLIVPIGLAPVGKRPPAAAAPKVPVRPLDDHQRQAWQDLLRETQKSPEAEGE